MTELIAPLHTNPEEDDLIGPVHHVAWKCVDRRLAFEDSAITIYLNKCIMATHQAIVIDNKNIHRDVLVVHLTHMMLKGHNFTIVNM